MAAGETRLRRRERRRAARPRRAGGRAGRLGGVAAAVALALALLPGAASAADPVGCGYAAAGTGRYASTICWLDMSAYNDVIARSPAGQPMTVTLPGGYTVSFTVRTSTPAGRTARALTPVAFPAFAGSRIGTSHYTGVPGRPALYQAGGTRPSPVDPDGGWTDVSLTDIAVRDATGASVSGYAFAVAEVEATANQESLTWTSDRPLTLLESVGGPQTGNAGCEVNLVGLGTRRVSCNTPPIGGAVSGGNTNLIMRADSPTVVTESMGATLSGNRNAEAFGIVTSKLELTKQVAGRVKTGDSFDLAARSPEGTVAGSATTGPADTATTGELTVLPRTNGGVYTLGEAATATSGTRLDDYGRSWACTNNGVAMPALSGATGTAVEVAPDPGDFIRCTVTNTQLPADLSIVKTATSRPALPGRQLAYELVVRNAGPSAATDVRVADPLPAELTFVSADSGCTLVGGEVTCALDSLAPGASHTFTVTTRVADGAVGTIRNTASVTSRTPDPDPSDNRDPEEVPVEPLADLAIVKEALSKRLVPGRRLTYRLTITNRGPSAARAVVASDPLPRGLSFVSASRGCSFASGTVTCSAGDMALGATATFEIVTRVASSVTGRVVNTATVDSPTRDPDPSNNRDPEEVPSGPEADLAIVKRPSVATVGVGGQLFYTLVVSNNGPSDATGVTVEDLAPAGLTLLSARASQGSCTTSAGAVVCKLGRLADGGTAQVLVSARADKAGELVNRATVGGNEPDPDPGNDEDERRIVVPPTPPTAQPADLGIVKSSNRRALVGKGAIVYTLRVTNHGPGVVGGVQVLDTPSLPVKVRSVRPSVGSCARGVPIRCDLGTLAVGARATIRVVAQPLAPGSLRNSASVTGDVPDPRSGNNIDGVTTKVRGKLLLRKTASRATLRAGQSLTYRIAVTNASGFALRAVRVCDRLPSGIVALGAKPKGQLVRGQLCWTVAKLGAGKSRSFAVRAKVVRGAAGRKVNTATATARGARPAHAKRAVRVAAGQVKAGGVTG